ncbi:MAG: hypothetical protein HQL73_06610 [Magnetococcales bacterium]|nr:hypothetical protein [Magnetococcales bacterium]
MHPRHVLELVIRPALQFLNMDGEAAERLLLGTAIQESGCGLYLRQLNSGVALGIFQMEPKTHDDIWNNWLRWQAPLRTTLLARLGTPNPPDSSRLITDLFYAAVMCRLHYRRVPQPIPAADDLPGLAAYWKDHYNTSLGQGSVTQFQNNWHRFLGLA